jgi:hypothetical protein
LKLNKVPLYGRGYIKSLVDRSQISFDLTEDDSVKIMRKMYVPIDTLVANRVCYEIVGSLKGWPVI